MRVFTVIVAALLVMFTIGCDSEKSTASNEEALNYDVIGTDAPESAEAAYAELADAAISVPNPVTADNPQIRENFDLPTAIAASDRSAVNDEGRVNFRRILAHLHEQMQNLRRCMAENEGRNPELRRLAFGAHIAIEHGLRALRAGEPRVALRFFHHANRVLNLANRLCRDGD